MNIKSQKFNKQYDLQKGELIGEGNFAQVFKIFDAELKKFIAIRKVVKSQCEKQDIQKEKKINQQLQKVKSNHILQIYQIIESTQYIWYLTQYCEGGSLWDALNEVKSHKFTEIQTLQCVIQIAKGVQQLHNQRITHRDLKPENILLTKKYQKGAKIPDLKIADFGLSTKKLIMETVAGTKEYLAPQQAKFHTYTNAVDVWSIGIIFDELLHGNPYYTGQNNKQVFEKILRVEYKVRDQKINESIKSLLVSILKKKAYERPIIGALKARSEQILQDLMTKAKALQSSKISKKNISFIIDTNSDKQLESNKQNSETDKQIEQIRQTQTQVVINNINLQIVDQKIPIYKSDRKKIYSVNKKHKKEELTKNLVQINTFLDEVLVQKQIIEKSFLQMKDFDFNPNSKLNPIEVKSNLNLKFKQIKKSFDCLNEVSYDETYEVKLMQIKNKIFLAEKFLEAEKKVIKNELKQKFFQQLDLYIEEVIMKNIN